MFVGGYPSQCVGSGTCDFQWLLAQTPTVSSISPSGMTLTITGTGFSTTLSSNNVIIGTSGVCTVSAATTTSLTCTISAAPAGTYGVQVNIAGKGLATGTGGTTVTIPLQITSISPTQGGAGKPKVQLRRGEKTSYYSLLLKFRWWLYTERYWYRIFFNFNCNSRRKSMYKPSSDRLLIDILYCATNNSGN